MIRKFLIVFGIIAATFYIDISSKYFIHEYLSSLNTASHLITDFLNMNASWNRGISFSMLNNLSNAPFIITLITGTITLLLIAAIFFARSEGVYVGLSFVVGGALGNLVDRVKHEAVFDFIDLHYMGYHWPTFNFADSFIFVGVALLIYENFFYKGY